MGVHWHPDKDLGGKAIGTAASGLSESVKKKGKARKERRYIFICH